MLNRNGEIFMYAQIIIEIPAKSVDKMFTYIIPNSLLGKVLVGARVKVPFGHQVLEGFVLIILTSPLLLVLFIIIFSTKLILKLSVIEILLYKL